MKLVNQSFLLYILSLFLIWPISQAKTKENPDKINLAQLKQMLESKDYKRAAPFFKKLSLKKPQVLSQVKMLMRMIF